jgi:hypothetical protein
LDLTEQDALIRCFTRTRAWPVRIRRDLPMVRGLRRVVTGMSDTGAGMGKVVVNRAMSVDGFIAGPDNAMDWVFEYMKEDPFPEVMAATGAMLVGRGTHEVAKRMSEEDTDYDGGPVFVLTHQPPDEPERGVTFLSCDVAEAVATARAVAGGKNWRSSVRT